MLWPHVLAWSIVGLSAFASAHAILVKRDTRSTIGWVGLIWLSPVFGPLIYFFLGVNRIRSRATHLRSGVARATLETRAAVPELDRIREAIGPDHAPLRSLATLVGRVAGRPLVDGNAIEPLAGGDEAYPAMLAAIDGARQSIGLSTYIFDNDPTGRLFADALGRAVDRGVEVRVLIDGIGSTYSFPPITRLLASRGVRVNAIGPGLIATPLNADARQNPDYMKNFEQRIPLGRLGEPVDIAGPAVFLASDLARYVTGVTLPVDGGFLSL